MMKFLLDLVFPRRAVCMGCGSMIGCERNDICDECRERMAKSWVGVQQMDKKSGLDGAAFAYGYQGVAGSVVRRMKYGSVGILAAEMGADLAKAAAQLRIDKIDMIIPVPMHPKRLRERGFNHSALLAQQMAGCMDLPWADVLMRTRNVRQQVRLSDAERRRNLDGVFAVRTEYLEGLCGATVVLVDDVYTTGTTARECAAVLRKAGVRKVYFAGYTISKGSKKRRK